MYIISTLKLTIIKCKVSYLQNAGVVYTEISCAFILKVSNVMDLCYDIRDIMCNISTLK